VIHSFQQNLERNGITTVRTYQQGVSSDGRFLDVVTNPQNSGSASCYLRSLEEYGRTTGTR
jgi:hypothetical protein